MSRRGTATLLSSLLMGLAAALPIGRDVDAPVWLLVGAPVVLTVAAARTAWLGRGRIVLGVLAATWTGAALLSGSGPVDAVVLGCGAFLRLWAGVPELLTLGRRGLLDLIADLTGGVCAAGLVLLTALGTPSQAPTSLALALGGGALLVLLGTRRLRR
jgi:hypothetical protein